MISKKLNFFLKEHFTKDKNPVNVNLMLANVKLTSTSAEYCASFCLNTTTFDSKPFKCLSFDYCPMQASCVFYTSKDTDPSVISQSAPVCEHYPKKPNNRIFEIYFMSVNFICSNKNYLKLYVSNI